MHTHVRFPHGKSHISHTCVKLHICLSYTPHTCVKLLTDGGTEVSDAGSAEAGAAGKVIDARSGEGLGVGIGGDTCEGASA